MDFFLIKYGISYEFNCRLDHFGCDHSRYTLQFWNANVTILFIMKFNVNQLLWLILHTEPIYMEQTVN